MFTTPILLIVFNRPATTRRVLDRLRELRPAVLYVAADGPRPDRPDDLANCGSVLAAIREIDWPCQVMTLIREKNLGCRRGVSTAISWFFELEEEGIIVEDDILPDLSFFEFCREMLARHRTETRVMHISGFNVCGRWRDGEQTYHLSRFGSIWGWASSRRAWKHYDVEIKEWSRPQVQKRILETYFPRELYATRKALYDDLHAGRIDTWDYQWTLCRLLQNGVSIVPARNLVQNIGFDGEATHTRSAPRWVMNESFALHQPFETRATSVDQAYDQLHLLLSTHNISFSDYQKLTASRRKSAA